jgi:uncharacterized membrane protein
MKLVVALIGLHLLALIFGVVGLLVALPNPHLWASSPWGPQVFTLGMTYSGQTHIVFGAIAMVALGARWLGWTRTLIFLVAAATISLGAELLGTATGWPFGAYSYTEGLGVKIADRVPYTIPLSWFYMGLASYLLASVAVARSGLRARAVSSVILGAWLLMAWDLVLDPAMAHESLPVQFWVWHATGPYFGMPIINFVGWFATALAFMAVSRWLWGAEVGYTRMPVLLLVVVFVANLAFAGALSLSVGLWQPLVIAAVVSLLPLLLVARLPSLDLPVAPARTLRR